jgi:hypothetical protein
MTEALPLHIIIAYSFYAFFAAEQKFAIQEFRGRNQAYYNILMLFMAVTSLFGIGYLVYYAGVLPSLEVRIMDNLIILIEKQVYKNVTHFGGQIPEDLEVFLRRHPSHIDGQFECDQSQYRSTDFLSAS